MKKYNLFNLQWVLMWIVVPVLCFLLSVNVTYAYFTATASKKESTATTGKIMLQFSNDTSGKAVNKVSETNTVNILPGDTLNISGALQNTGTADAYAIMEVEVYVVKLNSNEREYITHKYYTFIGDSLVEISGTSNAYTTTAATISAGQSKSFNLNYLFDGKQYGNEYKKATVTYALNGYSIQTANVSANLATETLLENAGYKYLQVYGNSIQSGTPSPSNPVEIQSVGEKTKNLINVHAISHQNIKVDANGKITMPYVTIATSNGYYSTNTKLSTLCPDLKVGDTVMFSLTTTSSNKMIYLDKSKHIWYANSTRIITQDDLDSNLVLYGNRKMSGEHHQVEITNLQIELGSKVTPYEPYGYKIPIEISKNLFSNATFEQGTIYDASGTLSDSTTRVRTSLLSLDAGTYAIKVDNTDKMAVRGVHLYNYQTEVWEQYININSANSTFTLANHSKVRFVFNSWNSIEITADDVLAKNPILQLGNSIEEPTTTYVYLDQPLRKVGNYADVLDLQTGTVTRNVRHLELAIADMNNYDAYPGWSSVDQIKADFPNQNAQLSNNTTFMCNIHSASSGIGINTSNTSKTLWLQTGTFSLNQTEWKATYPNLVVKIDYGMPTPEIETVIVPNINQFDGTVVKIGTTVQPSSTISQNGDALPAEYQQVEYIQSSGTQYIDTGYKANQDTSIHMNVSSTSTANQAFYCSRSGLSSNTFSCFIVSNYVRHDYCTSQTATSLKATTNSNYNIYASKNQLYINGTLLNTATEAKFTASYNMYLGASFDGSNTGNFLIGKIYSCSIWDDDTLVRDFIPCYRKSDNVVGLYDRVTNTFFTNAGTGTFTKGANI